MTSIVKTTEPTTWAEIASKPHTYSLCESSVTISAEKVEKVERPPRKPVVISNRISGGIAVLRVTSSIAMPIRKPATRLAGGGASREVGKKGLALIAQA